MTEITGEKMDELRRLAEAATPGPWVAEFQELGSCIAANDVSIATAFGTAAITGKPLPHEENAAYIAACSPDVILALLDRASSPTRSAEGMVTDEMVEALASRVQELEKENARLQAIVAGCDWYWPEGDTSSDACADGPWQLAENWDVKPGDIFAYSRGGVVETRYFGFLPPVDDAESDDNFEVDEPTEELAKSKILAEVERRAILIAKESDQ